MLQIDHAVPDRALTGTWIELRGSGFRPVDSYQIQSVVFQSAADQSVHLAEFAHVFVPATGEISDDILRVRVPGIADGLAWVWIEAYRLLPPRGDEGKPDPGDPLPPLEEPNIEHMSSNRIHFLVLCASPFQNLTETTMPAAVATAVETGILELQELFGGALVVPVDNQTRGSKCWGFRVTDVEARIAFEDNGIATEWNGDLWTVTLTGRIDISFVLYRRQPDTLCQWVRVPGVGKAGGGGHRWTVTTVPCADGACELVLHYVGGSFEMGGFNFVNVPDWVEEPLREDVERAVREASIGADGGILRLVEIYAQAGYRDAQPDCPPPDLSDVCVSRRVLEPLPEHATVLTGLRGLRDEIFMPSASGRDLVALYYRLSGDLTRVLMRNPALRAESLALLQEVSDTLAAKDPGQRIPLTAERLARARALRARAERHLSPEAIMALRELDTALEPFVGQSLEAIRQRLGAWRIPTALRALLGARTH